MTDLEYLAEACRHAATHSHDPNTQNGAILVAGRHTVYAANCVPPGVKRNDRRLSAPVKYDFIEHAERAAIHRAAAAGFATAGATLYCPWFACPDCARAIIIAGVREVVGLISLRNATPARWLKKVEVACEMIEEAGVGQRLLAGSVGVTIRFDGRDFPC
jgi:deoxycytidylate deaminase